MTMEEFRCEQCDKLLFKEDVLYGEVEIKCDRCNRFNRFKYIAEMFTAELLTN